MKKSGSEHLQKEAAGYPGETARGPARTASLLSGLAVCQEMNALPPWLRAPLLALYSTLGADHTEGEQTGLSRALLMAEGSLQRSLPTAGAGKYCKMRGKPIFLVQDIVFSWFLLLLLLFSWGLLFF